MSFVNICFPAPPAVASTSKPAENKEQVVYLRCVDSQGKVYLISQKMVTKVRSAYSHSFAKGLAPRTGNSYFGFRTPSTEIGQIS